MPRERIYLSDEDIQRLKAMEEDLIWLEEEIARAERAGIDVTDLRKRYDEIVRLREGLIREYSPPKEE
ncbi:MAG: hypothetical protein DRH24_06480 [Deltaproteobacteria bacterium]|nr:MAG: hypothetical protein DRH24_06480 [Deltaproteobacteria bacterium]